MKKLSLFFAFMLSILAIVKAQSCQNFTIQLDSQIVSHPILELNEFKICEGDTLIIGAIADFPNNNEGYVQTQSNTKFIWQFESMSIDTAIIVHKPFDQPVIKNFILRAVDVNGCNSSNQIYGKILASGNPIIEIESNIIVPVNTTVLLNASQNDNSTLLFQPIEIPRPPVPIVYLNEDTVFLPDGNNICYNDEISIMNFSNNQVLINPFQIKSIVLNMEHSYLEDLSIRITCPSGKVAILKSYSSSFPAMSPGGVVANACSSMGGSTNLGCAIDAPSYNLCYLSPGIGFDYEFRPGSTGCFGTGGSTVECNFIDQCGTNWSFPTLTPSIPNIYTNIPTPPVYYGSFQNLSALIGCPLNGNWKITVCDHLAVDNGYIFHWGINFDESLQANPIPYIIGVDSVTWTGSNLTPIDLFSASVYQTNPGLYNYSVSVHDKFGCNYDTTLTINTTVSVENFSNEQSPIKFYPNPATYFINGSTSNTDWNNSTIELIDQNGKLLQTVSMTDSSIQIDLSNYAVGQYYIKSTNKNNNSHTVKIVVIR
jgi:subtilisin-like proprotein convertase family protein